MISSETPSKLVEIIHDTWPQIYRPMIKKAKKPIDEIDKKKN
jgi:hypothetical protein